MTPQNPNNLKPSAILLRQIGEQLYGRNWQTPLSAAIGVSDRSMRRWVSGDDDIPRGVWADIHRHAEARWLPIKYFDDEVVRLLNSEISDPLQPIANTSPTQDGHGLSFAMQTGKGRPIHCYILREVLDDRVSSTPFKRVLDYFRDYAIVFYSVAQRKFDAGKYENGVIEISNRDVIGLALPDIRFGGVDVVPFERHP